MRPLLGRGQEIGLYLHLYQTARDRAKQNSSENGDFFGILIIQGESRQGKTRLLEELIYTTDSKTPICRFTLTKVDLKVRKPLSFLIIPHHMTLDCLSLFWIIIDTFRLHMHQLD